MPSRRLANSTPAVLRTLKTAHDTYLNTADPNNRAITPDQFAQLDLTVPTSLYSRFLKECSEVDLALAAQAPLTSDLSQKAARLTMLVSHFHQVLDLGITRGDFATGARSYYGRSITTAALPSLTTYAAVAEAAQKIVDGETARQGAEGAAFVPMSLPAAEAVGTCRAAFTTARNAAQQAIIKTDDEREDVTELYPAAQELSTDLCDTVEFFYRKDPEASSHRVKCIRWGVVYFYEPSETPDVVPEAVPEVVPGATTPSANPEASPVQP